MCANCKSTSSPAHRKMLSRLGCCWHRWRAKASIWLNFWLFFTSQTASLFRGVGAGGFQLFILSQTGLGSQGCISRVKLQPESPLTSEILTVNVVSKGTGNGGSLFKINLIGCSLFLSGNLKHLVFLLGQPSTRTILLQIEHRSRLPVPCPGLLHSL